MSGESTFCPLRKILSFDYGPGRTGVAVSTGSFLARPLTPLIARGKSSMKKQILESVLKEKPDLVLIGDCAKGSLYNSVLVLGKSIEERGYGVQVVPEEYSTKAIMEKLSYMPRQKKRTLKKSGRLDSVVATSLIEEYLERPL